MEIGSCISSCYSFFDAGLEPLQKFQSLGKWQKCITIAVGVVGTYRSFIMGPAFAYCAVEYFYRANRREVLERTNIDTNTTLAQVSRGVFNQARSDDTRIGSTVITDKATGHHRKVEVLMAKALDTYTCKLVLSQPIDEKEPSLLGQVAFGVRTFPQNGESCESGHYGSEISEKGKTRLRIGHILSYENSSYTGIGSALMQAAIEIGFKNGCEGRVELNAVGDSHLFYRNKMHFRSAERDATAMKIDKKMASWEVERGKDRGSYMMFLPYDSRVKWCKRINTNPIVHNHTFVKITEKSVVEYLPKDE